MKMAPFCETFVLYCGLGPLPGTEQRFSVVGYNKRLIHATAEARRDGRVRQGVAIHGKARSAFGLEDRLPRVVSRSARDFAAELLG